MGVLTSSRIEYINIKHKRVLYICFARIKSIIFSRRPGGAGDYIREVIIEQQQTHPRANTTPRPHQIRLLKNKRRVFGKHSDDQLLLSMNKENSSSGNFSQQNEARRNI